MLRGREYLADNLQDNDFWHMFRVGSFQDRVYLSVTSCIEMRELCREGAEMSMAQTRNGTSRLAEVHLCKHVTVGDARVSRLLVSIWITAEKRYHVHSTW
jgi:hypothetical protein